ncbi:Thiopurine S-methyltransferase [Pseudozyma hubeiensis]|nr:Thiopurine S-methyltransferase [Pseudozyma hubeiensis]
MASSLSKDDQIQNLRKLFADSDIPNDPKAWDKAWVDSTTPWDANKAQPALVELLRGAHDADTQVPDADGKPIPISQAIPKGDGTAVVPGCGRGYDAKVFAERGMTTYGVDVSSAAVAAANKWLDDQDLPTDLDSKVNFAEADFFSLGSNKSVVSELSTPGQARLAYDYTFLCAIPPALRTQWAETYTRLLQKDGVLIALVFPIHGDRPGGPPFSISPQLVRELLGSQKNADSSAAWNELAELKPKGPETRPDVERIMVWRRS